MAILAILAALALSHVLPLTALEFEMQMQTKCIFEELNEHALVVGDFKIFHRDVPDHPIPAIVRVQDPRGRLIKQQNSISEGQFAFTSQMEGEYQACFTVHDQQTALVTKIKLDWKTGVNAQDWDNIAKQEHLDDITVSLRKHLTAQQKPFQLRELSDITNGFAYGHLLHALRLPTSTVGGLHRDIVRQGSPVPEEYFLPT
eukprot:gene11320-18594_t